MRRCAVGFAATTVLTACTGEPTGDPLGTRCEPPVRTAGDVPAHLFILRGDVTCDEATQVMRDYYTSLSRGEAPGMGGGGPVPVGPWTCVSGPGTQPDTTCGTEDGREIGVELQE